jgi:hypothetical protein
MKKWEELTELEKNTLADTVADNTGDTYWCKRVWSAWSYGTMTQEDFEPLGESNDFLDDVSKSLYEKIYEMHESES